MTASPDEIAAAEAYEDLHVPALFAQWAPAVLDLADIRAGDRILDVACGTGVLAREARQRHGRACSVSGLDADAGMLAVAASRDSSIDWRQGFAESLPYADATFDFVCNQFGLMFVQDRGRAVREMLRVAAPGGRLVVVVWDSLENNEAYALLVELLELRVSHKAADALRAPFALGNRAEVLGLFTDAGAVSAEASTRQGTACFPNVRIMVEADLRGWLPVMGVILPEDLIDAVLSEAESVLGRFVTEDGQVEFGAPAHIVTACAPALS